MTDTRKPATIKEIARQLNVSVSTVSRALRDHPGIGLRTRQRVQELAAQLNYEPNQAAISFKQGRTRTIGLIVPNLREEFFCMAIQAVDSRGIPSSSASRTTAPPKSAKCWTRCAATVWTVY